MMKTENSLIMDFLNKGVLEFAAQTIKNGGLIAFPTDTVYGLACDYTNVDALQKLFDTKGRDFNKAIAVLIGEFKQIDLVACQVTPAAIRLAERFWPGALTLIIPKQPSLPDLLSPYPTIGVRMPDHIRTRQLLRYIGPLATTSANLSGESNPLTAADVNLQLGEKIDLILDGGRCRGGIPSTVVDCTQVEPVILRVGAISKDEILSCF